MINLTIFCSTSYNNYLNGMLHRCFYRNSSTNRYFLHIVRRICKLMFRTVRALSPLFTSPIISIAQHLIFIVFSATSYTCTSVKLAAVQFIASEITFMTDVKTIYLKMSLAILIASNCSISNFVAFGLSSTVVTIFARLKKCD